MQQRVNEQKFLFESGLPCKLGMLVNGLIILDQPLDLRDHVRGDSLLHAPLREGNNSLAQKLVENGVDVGAVNWAGFSAHPCTQDAAVLELLDTVARLPKQKKPCVVCAGLATVGRNQRWPVTRSQPWRTAALKFSQLLSGYLVCQSPRAPDSISSQVRPW